MQCAESLRVQAYFDGELDALSSADVERHSERCAKCQSLLQDLEQLRSTLRQDLTYPNAPPELRARIMRALDKESATSSATYQRKRAAGWRLQPFWRGAFSGVGVLGSPQASHSFSWRRRWRSRLLTTWWVLTSDR